MWSILLVLFVFLLFFASLGFVCTHWSCWTIRGTFGDSFGALNALFSGLAFAGLIVTLIMQKDELSMQREELDEAKQELRQQSIEFKKQNKTLKLQRFESTFFNMLNLQETITRNLHYDCSDGGDSFECVMEEWYSINSTHIKCWILKKTSGESGCIYNAKACINIPEFLI